MLQLAQKQRAGVRLTELLGGGAQLLATPPPKAMMPEPRALQILPDGQSTAAMQKNLLPPPKANPTSHTAPLLPPP
jgi:hypothetical protein